MEEKVRCRKCKYFYITWDTKFPNGCSMLKFKSRNMPSSVVRHSSGLPCQFFTMKKSGEPPPAAGGATGSSSHIDWKL